VRSPEVGLGHTLRTIVLLAVILLAGTRSTSAQVGLSSKAQQIALLARVPARVSLQEVVPLRETVSGSIRETSVRVRLAVNTGSRLIVRGSELTGVRLWVRAADGQFHELTVGTSLMVARNTTGTEEWQPEVQYRLESGARMPQAPLPVRYEVVIDPAL
jgi:hypothetical protein